MTNIEHQLRILSPVPMRTAGPASSWSPPASREAGTEQNVSRSPWQEGAGQSNRAGQLTLCLPADASLADPADFPSIRIQEPVIWNSGLRTAQNSTRPKIQGRNSLLKPMSQGSHARGRQPFANPQSCVRVAESGETTSQRTYRPSIAAITFENSTPAVAFNSSLHAPLSQRGPRDQIRSQGEGKPRMTFSKGPKQRTRQAQLKADGVSLRSSGLNGSKALGFATSRCSAGQRAYDSLLFPDGDAVGDRFETNEFRESLYSRENDVGLTKDRRPFYIDQMERERLIKTSKSHTLRARQHIQAYQAARGIIQPTARAGDYILDRFNANQRLYERAKKERAQQRLQELVQLSTELPKMKLHALAPDDSDSMLAGPLSVRGQGRAPLVGLARQGLDGAASAVLGNPSTKRGQPSDNAKVVQRNQGEEETQAYRQIDNGTLVVGKASAEPVENVHQYHNNELSRSHISITEQQLKELGVVNVGLESTHNMFELQMDQNATQMTKSDEDLEASGTHTQTHVTNRELVPGRSTANQVQQTEYRPIKSQIKRFSSNAVYLALGSTGGIESKENNMKGQVIPKPKTSTGNHQLSPVTPRTASIHIPVRQSSPVPSQQGSPNSPLGPVSKPEAQKAALFQGLNLSRIIPTAERASTRSAQPLWLANKKYNPKAGDKRLDMDSKNGSHDLEHSRDWVLDVAQAAPGTETASTELPPTTRRTAIPEEQMAKQPSPRLRVAMSPRFILQTRGVYKNVRRHKGNKPAFDSTAEQFDNLNLSANSIGQIIDASLQTIYKNIETSKNLELVHNSTGIGSPTGQLGLLRARDESPANGEAQSGAGNANTNKPMADTAQPETSAFVDQLEGQLRSSEAQCLQQQPELPAPNSNSHLLNVPINTNNLGQLGVQDAACSTKDPSKTRQVEKKIAIVVDNRYRDDKWQPSGASTFAGKQSEVGGQSPRKQLVPSHASGAVVKPEGLQLKGPFQTCDGSQKHLGKIFTGSQAFTLDVQNSMGEEDRDCSSMPCRQANRVGVPEGLRSSKSNSKVVYQKKKTTRVGKPPAFKGSKKLLASASQQHDNAAARAIVGSRQENLEMNEYRQANVQEGQLKYHRRLAAQDSTLAAPELLLAAEQSSPLNSGTITQMNIPVSGGQTDEPSITESQSNVRTSQMNCKSESTFGVNQAAGPQGSDPKAHPGETEHQPGDGMKAATASDQQQIWHQMHARAPEDPGQALFAAPKTNGGGRNMFTARPAVSIIIIEQAANDNNNASGTAAPADASGLNEMMIIQNNLYPEVQQAVLPANQQIGGKRWKPNSKERARQQSRHPPRVLSQVEELAKNYFETTYKSLEKEKEMKAVIDGGFQILQISPRARLPAASARKQYLIGSQEAAEAAVKVGAVTSRYEEVVLDNGAPSSYRGVMQASSIIGRRWPTDDQQPSHDSPAPTEHNGYSNLHGSHLCQSNTNSSQELLLRPRQMRSVEEDREDGSPYATAKLSAEDVGPCKSTAGNKTSLAAEQIAKDASSAAPRLQTSQLPKGREEQADPATRSPTQAPRTRQSLQTHEQVQLETHRRPELVPIVEHPAGWCSLTVPAADGGEVANELRGQAINMIESRPQQKKSGSRGRPQYMQQQDFGLKFKFDSKAGAGAGSTQHKLRQICSQNRKKRGQELSQTLANLRTSGNERLDMSISAEQRTQMHIDTSILGSSRQSKRPAAATPRTNEFRICIPSMSYPAEEHLFQNYKLQPAGQPPPSLPDSNPGCSPWPTSKQDHYANSKLLPPQLGPAERVDALRASFINSQSLNNQQSFIETFRSNLAELPSAGEPQNVLDLSILDGKLEDSCNKKGLLTPPAAAPLPTRLPRDQGKSSNAGRPGARDLFRLPTSAVADIEKAERVALRPFGLIGQCAPMSLSPARDCRPLTTAATAVRQASVVKTIDTNTIPTKGCRVMVDGSVPDGQIKQR